MKKKQIAVGLLASLFAVAPTIMHAEDCCMPSYKPDEPLCDDEACAIYSAYAGTQLECGWDVYGFGEFLYWMPVRVTAWVALATQGNPPPLESTQFELAHKFGYRPAFRVGIGMVLHNFDDWIFNADYTWYHHSFTKTFSVTAPFNLASTLVLGTPLINPTYRSIRNKSDFNYDIAGVNLQRPNYLGQRVILSPFLGLKWLKRNLKIEQDLTQSATGLIDNAHATLSYTSIGLAAGFDGNWLMCWGLRLVGKADVALLYPYQRKFSETTTITATTPPSVLKTKQNIKHLGIFGKGGMGLGWGSYLCCNRYHVDFSATFDFMTDVAKIPFAIGMFERSATMLMGLTIHGQFDF